MKPVKGKLYKIDCSDVPIYARYNGIAWCIDDKKVVREKMTCWRFKLVDIDSNGELAMFGESDIVKEIPTE